ncbi:hypothetical protein SpCBS45565_g02490 [Spizellomyces sp. 'palustris']|nr:hypothetical protein SpCBS45565_g02490 [Spizellomyces sp. 'palustris']
MSLFSRPKKQSDGPSAGSLQDGRRKQITSLHTHQLAVRELQPDTVYEVTTTTPSSLTLQLTITLPPTFPETPPGIQVKPPVQHAWVDKAGYVIGHERLARWDAGQGIVLGRLLREIIQEFAIRPPSRAEQSYQHHHSPTTTSVPGSALMHPQHAPIAEFPEVDRLSLEELDDLLKNEEALGLFFEQMEHVKNMRQVHADLAVGNEALARRNLEKENEINALKSSLTEQIKLMRSQKNLFDENSKIREDELMRFGSDYITSKLRAALSQSDELSDSIATSFVEGKLGADDFLKQFRDVRKVYHLRAAKLERISREPGLLSAP